MTRNHVQTANSATPESFFPYPGPSFLAWRTPRQRCTAPLLALLHYDAPKLA